jgi:uncharacterized phage protein (TIGR02218 family)
MSRVFLDRPLDTVASFWRVHRSDGVALGFTTHDRDLWFGGLLHRAAPGLTPSAVRRTSGFADEGADVEGALAHDCISAIDLGAGRYDGAEIAIGAVDWETLEHAVVFVGTIEGVSREGNAFTAELASAKAALAVDTVQRSSPACRARFCGPGCTLSPARFTVRATVAGVEDGRLTFTAIDPALYVGGELRWLDGPLAGLGAYVLAADGSGLVLDGGVQGVEPGMRALLREGCDHTVATCAARFRNAENFQGEPFLPGTDLLAHYPMPR